MQILDSEAVGSRQSNEFGRFLCDVISREFNARAIVEELLDGYLVLKSFLLSSRATLLVLPSYRVRSHDFLSKGFSG